MITQEAETDDPLLAWGQRQATAAAQARRDLGQDRSAHAAGEDWREYALRFIQTYLATHQTLFCDDLWSAGLRRPASPRGLGAVMSEAHRRRWIEMQFADTPSGRLTLARPSTASNQQLKPVWKSNLYQPRNP